MALFGILVVVAVVVCAALADASPLVVQDGSQRELTTAGRDRLRVVGRAVVAANRFKQTSGEQMPSSQPPKAYAAPTPYSSPVCFNHHGCGLEGKRGERDRGISPIIPGVTRDRCCNKKSGVG
ncbi:unnamed protein product, partial [Aphanomyces euteiches]